MQIKNLRFNFHQYGATTIFQDTTVQQVQAESQPDPSIWQQIWGGLAVRFPLLLVASCASTTETTLPTTITKTPASIQYTGEIISVAGGTFTMGSTDGDPDEMKSDGTLPIVTISPFKMAKTEFTIGEAKDLLEKTPNQKLKAVLQNLLGKDSNQNKTDQFALGGANYQEASMICAALGGRLPKPEEIEYVAKHGSENRPYGIPIERLREGGGRQQVCGNKSQLTNTEGFCDIPGGLWEMTSGQYTHNYDTISSQDPINNGLVDLMTPEALHGDVEVKFGDRFVEYRGASWNQRLWGYRSANRLSGFADRHLAFVGFHVAWSWQ